MKTANPMLMIPGPVMVSEKTLKAMGSPVQAHYGPEWTQLYNETVADLKKVFNTQGDVFIMVGSGTSGLEACISSAFTEDEKVLVCINGHFGNRLKLIADSYGLNCVPVVGEMNKPMDPAVVEKAAQANPDAKGILLVHLETSTSILNPVEEIGSVAHKYGMLLMVDAVASLGGTPFNMDRWNVDMCASASQKCLATPPGLSPIAVNETAWKKIYGNNLKTKDRGFYLNLRVWKKFAVEWADWHPFPVTMATSLVLGLKASLETLLEEGVDNRSRRLAKLGMRLRAGMREIGFEPYTPDEIMAPMLTAAYGPKGVPTSHIVKFVADQYDIRIAGGLGDALVDKVIRIGHMSPVITDKHVDMTLAALKAFHE